MWSVGPGFRSLVWPACFAAAAAAAQAPDADYSRPLVVTHQEQGPPSLSEDGSHVIFQHGSHLIGLADLTLEDSWYPLSVFQWPELKILWNLGPVTGNPVTTGEASAWEAFHDGGTHVVTSWNEGKPANWTAVSELTTGGDAPAICGNRLFFLHAGDVWIDSVMQDGAPATRLLPPLAGPRNLTNDEVEQSDVHCNGGFVYFNERIPDGTSQLGVIDPDSGYRRLLAPGHIARDPNGYSAHVVFTTYPESGAHVFLTDPFGGPVRRLTAGPGSHFDARISNRYVIYVSAYNGQWDIFLLFLGATPEEDRELRLTSHPTRESSPAISSRNAVWLDNRSGENHIYGVWFDELPPVNEWPLSRRALELLQESATTPTTTTTTQATTTTATTTSIPEPDGFVQTPPTTLAGAAPGDANVPPDAPDAAAPNAEETCEGTGLERARCALRGALNTHCSGDAESEKRPRNLLASTIVRLDRFAADHNERRALRKAHRLLRRGIRLAARMPSAAQASNPCIASAVSAFEAAAVAVRP